MKWLALIPIAAALLWLGRFWLALVLGRLLYRWHDRHPAQARVRRWARHLYRFAAR